MRPHTHNPWSKDHITYIKANANKLSDKEIASYLGRTERSIRHKRYDLGLKKKPKIRVKADAISRHEELINAKVTLMKSIIYIAENTSSQYIKDKCKSELKKLSEL